MHEIRETIEAFLNIFSPEREVAEDVRCALSRLCGDAELCTFMNALTEDFCAGRMNYPEAMTHMREHAQRLGVHVYTAHLVMAMHLAMLARDAYRDEGLDDLLWQDTMRDILYKCTECRLIYGITGTFVPEWFEWFFTRRRFCFGRLQFECIKSKNDYTVGDTVVRADDWRINIHIPRTGTPMSPEAVDTALAQAAAFFRARCGFSRTVFEIHSWLLWPEHESMLREGSNILHFMRRFTIVDAGEYKDYSHVWRLFDRNYDGDPDHLPADSSFRRAYIDRIKRGLPLGWGYGIFVYS